jgi:SAM-dependent methyltransferase
MMTTEQAVLELRRDPAYADLVRDAYLGRDVADSAGRFAASGEFAEVRRILGRRLAGATIVDLGAGVGIASLAFVKAGAGRVVAVDPDPSDEVGRGAMARLAEGGEFEIMDGVGEALPLPDASVDVVYCRQVLHHSTNLARVLAESARVLRPGGLFLACREHVVDDEAQLRRFLDEHPVNRLAGGEHAFRLPEYLNAIRSSGLTVDRVLGPWDSVINVFPGARTEAELEAMLRARLVHRLGPAGRLAIHLPGMRAAVRRRLDKRLPGRLYSFVAHKPGR